MLNSVCVAVWLCVCVCVAGCLAETACPAGAKEPCVLEVTPCQLSGCGSRLAVAVAVAA
jgi:hypothetical protein